MMLKRFSSAQIFLYQPWKLLSDCVSQKRIYSKALTKYPKPWYSKRKWHVSPYTLCWQLSSTISEYWLCICCSFSSLIQCRVPTISGHSFIDSLPKNTSDYIMCSMCKVPVFSKCTTQNEALSDYVKWLRFWSIEISVYSCPRHFVNFDDFLWNFHERDLLYWD